MKLNIWHFWVNLKYYVADKVDKEFMLYVRVKKIDTIVSCTKYRVNLKGTCIEKCDCKNPVEGLVV